jgi:alpha-L-rhamnosidase
MLQVGAIRIEYRNHPLGIDVRHPRFTWQIISDRRGVLQRAYRIQVALDETFQHFFWDSGQVASDLSLQVEYNGPELQPMTQYFFQVGIWDDRGEWSGWSSPTHWETGLLDPHTWQADWITADIGDEEVCPLLRRSFVLDEKPIGARLYITALGLYEARLNGDRVGDAVLTPGWTSYHHQIQYQTYDVGELLHAGENVLGVMLGNGWYRGNLAWQGGRHLYGNRRAVLAELHLHYYGGRTQVILSNRTWKAKSGPVLFSEIYHGEIYDARLEPDGWDRPGFRDDAWQIVSMIEHDKSGLIGQTVDPVRVVESRRPQALLRSQRGEVILDMGQNLVGWVRFRVRAAPGAQVKLQHAEVLDRDGNFYTDNLRSARQTVTYYCRGEGEEFFEPHFTFHGFRYVKVINYPGLVSLDNFTAQVVHSDLEFTGSFVCSDPLVNRLHENIVWSQRGNFVDVPTDCPQRDERLGWTGDAAVFVGTALFNMAAGAFFTKWLRDLSMDQHSDGGIPFVIPDVLPDKNRHSSAAWGDAATMCPWAVYLAYADRRLLREQYPSMKAWVEYIRHQGDDEALWNTGFHFGDWLNLDAKDANHTGETPTDFIATAFYAYSCELTARAARELGEFYEAAVYEALHQRIVERFRAMFLRTNGMPHANTQTAYVLALHFGLVPEDQQRVVATRLASIIRETGYLTTGFVGTPFVLKVLSMYGHHDLACELLRRTEYPSWLYEVRAGATTIWEHWDSLKPDGSFWSPGMNSFNHYAYGSIGEFLYRVLAGLNLDEECPGYRHVYVTPHLDQVFSYASVTYASMIGPIRAGWQRDKTTVTIDVEFPPNTTATVWLPDARVDDILESNSSVNEAEGVISIDARPKGVSIDVGSGAYHFHYPVPGSEADEVVT